MYVSRFQFLLCNTFDSSIVNCYFDFDQDFSFLALYPHKEYLQDIMDLSKVEVESENQKMNNFEVDRNKRGLHISLLISADQKSQFDMRRKKGKLIQFRSV